MTREATPIDLSAHPELASIAHEAARTGQPRPLVENGIVVAIVAPVRRPRRPRGKSIAPHAAERAFAAAGGWKGLVDPEEFRQQRRELQIHDREPLTL